jgi:hypothetical protein
LTIPFFALILLCLVQPQDILFALIFGAIFFYILLIKDFLLIDRKSAYEVLVFSLSFLLLRSFYEQVGAGITGLSLFYSFFVAIIIVFLARSFWQSRGTNIVHWLLLLTTWQLMIAGLFLPVDYAYQTGIIFLGLIVPIDLISRYLSGDVMPKKIFAVSSVVFAALVIVLASARWGL